MATKVTRLLPLNYHENNTAFFQNTLILVLGQYLVRSIKVFREPSNLDSEM